MGFRVECVDAESGRAMEGYVTRAASEAEVRAEADRLGVRITDLTPLDTPPLPDPDDAPLATRWNGRALRWRVEPSVLFRLGFEHPRWGARLYTTLLASVVLVRLKVMFPVLVVSAAGLFAAIGLELSGLTVSLLLSVIVLLVPFALCKRYVLAKLREAHAPRGFPTLHSLTLEGDELVHDRGGLERRIALRQIGEVHELPRFLLISLRDGCEVAVPRQAFAGASRIRAFSSLLAEATSAPLHKAYRSSWVGPEPLIKLNSRLGGFVIFAAIVLWLAIVVFLLK